MKEITVRVCHKILFYLSLFSLFHKTRGKNIFVVGKYQRFEILYFDLITNVMRVFRHKFYLAF